MNRRTFFSALGGGLAAGAASFVPVKVETEAERKRRLRRKTIYFIPGTARTGDVHRLMQAQDGDIIRLDFPECLQMVEVAT